MKRICLLLSLMLLSLMLLSACGQEMPSVPDGFTPAYTVRHLPMQPSESLNLQSNGHLMVGAKIEYEHPGGLYLLEPESDTVRATRFSDFGELQSYALLGVDDENGIWIAGIQPNGHGIARRLDTDGQLLLELDFGTEIPAGGQGFLSFTYDQGHFYFLIQEWSADESFDSYLVVFDRTGDEIVRRLLTDYYLDTAGYLPQESDWMEELEGREGDRLLEMLFPEGPVNEAGLVRLQDGSPALMLSRKSPIDAECYGILCPLNPQDYSITPVFSYPIDTAGGFRITSYFESADPNFDLLVNKRDGLYGLRLSDQSMTLLYLWSAADYPAANLSALSPGNPSLACEGPDGSLLLISWERTEKAFVCDLLTPNP